MSRLCRGLGRLSDTLSSPLVPGFCGPRRRILRPAWSRSLGSPAWVASPFAHLTNHPSYLFRKLLKVIHVWARTILVILAKGHRNEPTIKQMIMLSLAFRALCPTSPSLALLASPTTACVMTKYATGFTPGTCYRRMIRSIAVVACLRPQVLVIWPDPWSGSHSVWGFCRGEQRRGGPRAAHWRRRRSFQSSRRCARVAWPYRCLWPSPFLCPLGKDGGCRWLCWSLRQWY